MKQQGILRIAAIMGMLAVILGAFGAHVLREKWGLDSDRIRIFKTGIDYHFYHSFALITCALLWDKVENRQWLSRAATLFFVGILCFSGSLYLLACKSVLDLGTFVKILGPMTPIGGVFFILAWACLLSIKLKK